MEFLSKFVETYKTDRENHYKKGVIKALSSHGNDTYRVHFCKNKQSFLKIFVDPKVESEGDGG